MLRRSTLALILITACILLSSCYDKTDQAIQYDEDYHNGYEAGYEEGYKWGYESGYYDHGFPDGYDFGYEEASNQFENNFIDLWEDWLYQSYGITEQELCVLVGFYTATPQPSVSPSASSKPTPSPTPTFEVLSLSSQGEAVSRVQSRLNELGFACGTVDGIYGKNTAAAVSAFQKAASLPTSGQVTSDTIVALFAPYAPKATATPRPTVTKTATPKPTVKPTAKPTPKATSTPEPQVRYIGNGNTYKFHYTWCSSVDQMKESNKVFFYYRSDATSRGYAPCKRCDP